MTHREKRLATGLVALLGLGVAVGLVYFLAWEPYNKAKERAQGAQNEFDQVESKLIQEQAQIGAIFKVDPRLTQWNKISLPPRDPSWKANQPVTEEMRKRHVQN